MSAKTAAPAATTDRRADLRTAYLKAFDDFATTVADVREALETTNDDARRVLQRLEGAALLVSDTVNEDPTLVYQAAETYDTISRTTAIRRFDKAFPKSQPVEITEPVKTGRKGATGPRYTEQQIARAIVLRAQGTSWKAIGAELNIKATAYLAKLLKDDPRIGQIATAHLTAIAAERAAKPRKTAKADKPAGRRAVKRSAAKKVAGGNGPVELREMMAL